MTSQHVRAVSVPTNLQNNAIFPNRFVTFRAGVGIVHPTQSDERASIVGVTSQAFNSASLPAGSDFFALPSVASLVNSAILEIEALVAIGIGELIISSLQGLAAPLGITGNVEVPAGNYALLGVALNAATAPGQIISFVVTNNGLIVKS